MCPLPSSKVIVLLGAQLSSRCFFFFMKMQLYCEKWLQMNHSKYCPSLATTFAHLSSRARIPLR